MLSGGLLCTALHWRMKTPWSWCQAHVHFWPQNFQCMAWPADGGAESKWPWAGVYLHMPTVIVDQNLLPLLWEARISGWNSCAFPRITASPIGAQGKSRTVQQAETAVKETKSQIKPPNLHESLPKEGDFTSQKGNSFCFPFLGQGPELWPRRELTL